MRATTGWIRRSASGPCSSWPRKSCRASTRRSARTGRLHAPPEPEQREQHRAQREERSGRAEERADLRLLALHREFEVEAFVDLAQVGGGARIEIFGTGHRRNRLQSRFVEPCIKRKRLGP